ncbi:hypothetical protein L843_1609 [Mycobacterium intracellulare MIN_061107_1834]|nr:hypothetical protein L843_1609 [Mycobacterium intracellulare MIN_061107_1834]
MESSELDTSVKLGEAHSQAQSRIARGTTMTQFTDAPIFDADQHMYETPMR